MNDVQPYQGGYYENQNSLPPPQVMNQFSHTSEGALQYHIETNEVIADAERILRGQSPLTDEKTGLVIWGRPEHVRPMINDFGASKLLYVMRTHLNKVFVLSDLDEEFISQSVQDLGNIIIADIRDNWEHYEIPDFTTASLLVLTLTNMVYATLCKAKKANYLRFLQTAQQIQEVKHYAGQEQNRRQGILDSVVSMVKRR